MTGETMEILNRDLAESVTDNVNCPAHYRGSIECIHAIEAAIAGREGCEGFLIGQVIKYVWRAGKKGESLDDFKKARWYLDRLIDNRQSVLFDRVDNST